VSIPSLALINYKSIVHGSCQKKSVHRHLGNCMKINQDEGTINSVIISLLLRYNFRACRIASGTFPVFEMKAAQGHSV
jgi:hypothetical protein